MATRRNGTTRRGVLLSSLGDSRGRSLEVLIMNLRENGGWWQLAPFISIYFRLFPSLIEYRHRQKNCPRGLPLSILWTSCCLNKTDSSIRIQPSAKVRRGSGPAPGLLARSQQMREGLGKWGRPGNGVACQATPFFLTAAFS